MNEVSKQYHQRALDFFRGNPTLHVMARSTDKDIIAKWFTYFQAKGMHGTLATFREILTGNRPVMFPAPCPTLFDLSYIPPTRGFYRDPSEGGQETRGDVSGVVAETLASLRKAQPKGRQPVPKSHLQEPAKTPKQWLDEYQANPPPIPVFSDDFKARLGLKRGDEPGDEAAA